MTSLFNRSSRSKANGLVRSVAATGSLVTSFAAGLPIWALTGSRQEARNFSFSLFADTSCALIGMDFDIRGEENLWAARPAVFVINHQSKVDVMIAAKLLRRDFAGVAKKEARNIPLVGRVMEFGGIVLIDRQNTASAISAMAPLIDVIKKDNQSVVIAPEGTRSEGAAMGEFKKGAFHLAMNAGVPMIPIVIHNATEIAPKGEFIFQPGTVKIDVLEPIDTTQWSKETLDQHVSNVRSKFVKALNERS
jgi:putative phosphoserine phosphatase/1-acylglycerol-3-phosphate O-acyltransferase